MEKDEPILEMKEITKVFPGGVVANDNVDLSINRGEIHALLGENGAGKSTLMNILYGLYTADRGEILIDGNPVKISSPQDAIELGIGMVHQHFTLVPSFNVADNIILGLKEKGFKPNYHQINQEIRELGEKYGLTIDPSAKIWQLSVGEKQRVEILKLLYRKARILIMDEPTAVLTPQESKSLLETVRKLVQEGHSIIFITHKLEEVMSVTDRVTVMKDGQVAGNFRTDRTDTRELANAMVGRNVILKVNKKSVEKGEAIFSLQNVKAKNDKGLLALRDVSFAVHRGEILGIAGVAGNGQRELAEVISGLRELEAGKIYFRNREIGKHSPRQRIDMGLSFIPEDRLDMGVSPGLSVKDNLVLKNYRQSDFCRLGFLLNDDNICNYSRRMIEEYNVLTPDIETKSHLLSGGNIQKLILARELSADPDFILAVHPTRGLDISAIEFVYQTILAEREKMKAILLIAGDMEEIFTLCDRVMVLYEGQIVGELPAEEEYLEEIGLLMAGIRDDRVSDQEE